MRRYLLLFTFLLLSLIEAECSLNYRKICEFRIPGYKTVWQHHPPKMFIHEKKLYLLDGKGTLYIVDVSNPYIPKLFKKFEIKASDFHVEDGTLYALTQDGLYIIEPDFATKGPYSVKGENIQVSRGYIFTVHNKHYIRMQSLDSFEPPKEFYPFKEGENPHKINYIAEYPYVYIQSVFDLPERKNMVLDSGL
jgi:hypothetical protein